MSVNEVRGLDIHGNHPQGQFVKPLQEGDKDRNGFLPARI